MTFNSFTTNINNTFKQKLHTTGLSRWLQKDSNHFGPNLSITLRKHCLPTVSLSPECLRQKPKLKPCLKPLSIPPAPFPSLPFSFLSPTPMQSLRRSLPSIPLPSPPLSRAFVDARIRWVRDRALDHVVEKEKCLLPFLSLKDHLLSASPSPPHSLPLSSITPLKSHLSLPCRAVEFVRLFPSAFSETLPSPPLPPVPQIRPTEQLLSLHEEELHAAAICQSDVADRLLKLLMLSPSRRLPLWLVERLRWDLGLPRDFVRSVLPKFPDYFCTSPSKSKHGELDLEVVFYRRDLAVSAMER